MTEKLVLDTYPLLRMQRLGSIVVLQPWLHGEVAGNALSCDLETGTLSLTVHPPIQQDYTDVYGILGLSILEAGPAMVVITGTQQVAALRGHPLFRITSTQVLADTGTRKWKETDYKFLELFRSGVDPKKYGGQMFFSCGGDPTLTQQRYEQVHSGGSTALPAWKRAEPAFTWNRALAQPLIDDVDMARFVPTCFVGFVEQLRDLVFSSTIRKSTTTGTITLIARRSARRAGTRQWRRGADLGADVANFVESEQIVSFDDGSATTEFSFVQVRGSIPLPWAQTPCLKYKIPITIAAQKKCEPILAAHAKQLTETYGAVTAINLANQTGREGKLSAAYASAAASLPSETARFRLVPFDFHKQCGATNYKNLEVLWGDVVDDFRSYGYWTRGTDGSASTQQSGVFRTNCIDTLDRTNVVQGLLARKALEDMLRRQQVLSSEGDTLASAFPQVEVAFRVMWADHGDEISRQYAGTGAMKSAFTRTGKRDLAGLMDDGVKSLTRYFLNNFRDGEKQDALDLVTGNYKIATGLSSPFKPQGSPAFPLLVAVLLIWLAVQNAISLSATGELGFGVKTGQQVVLLVAVAVVIVRLMFKFGRHLVNIPNLRNDLAVPWSLS